MTRQVNQGRGTSKNRTPTAKKERGAFGEKVKKKPAQVTRRRRETAERPKVKKKKAQTLHILPGKEKRDGGRESKNS